ncbi:MAG TPA: putative toxin-antitoxin system toxin component, PIN family [Candidatus Eisenbacteria bacterium]|nr:putative toxin-antitoxin system toxin component, PIN family [Candidatus Eisenbacteria bacterium]
MRCVVDTNLVVSAAILPNSVPRQALSTVLNHDRLLASEPTLDELREVLFRPKFDPYVSRKERARFLAQFAAVAEIIPIIRIVRDCPDPMDDKFLELALNGGADVIVTGDKHLLKMNPWREIRVLRPAEYLKAKSGL